ncbi:hypothetical protein INR49_032922 [Caranx melampygus]|nr:hypothetical protein INR49_032922 [Caranx melampygus]
MRGKQTKSVASCAAAAARIHTHIPRARTQLSHSEGSRPPGGSMSTANHSRGGKRLIIPGRSRARPGSPAPSSGPRWSRTGAGLYCHEAAPSAGGGEDRDATGR